MDERKTSPRPLSHEQGEGRRLIQIVVGKDGAKQGTKVDVDLNPDALSVSLHFHPGGEKPIRNYPASSGGMAVNFPPGCGYEPFKMKEGLIIVTFNSRRRTIHFEADHLLIPLQEEPDADYITVVEPEPPVEIISRVTLQRGAEVMERLLAAQDQLLDLYGEELTYVSDDNDHIAGLNCSVYIGRDTHS